jgi:1,4-dihydroxy-2-naphthoyl-CoA hydrolase
MIWYQEITAEEINRLGVNSMEKHIGIEFTEVGADYLCAKMPVDSRTKQPFGLLHGGASVVLSETLGSTAAYLCLNPQTHLAVGIEINANHLRSVKQGFVDGIARPLHIGKTTHVWNIEIQDTEGKRVCVSRITLAIIEKNPLL